MKKTMAVGLLFVMIGSTYAADGETLMKTYGCMSCHKVDKKVVGPALKDVAVVYAADVKTKARFVEVIKTGSKGKWGLIPMPPQTKVSDADTELMFKWIISQK
jgi:cytochrome c